MSREAFNFDKNSSQSDSILAKSHQATHFVKLLRYRGQSALDEPQHTINGEYCSYSPIGNQFVFKEEYLLPDNPMEDVYFGLDENGGPWIENRCSELTCSINGIPILTGSQHPLANNDLIIIGVAELTIGNLGAIAPMEIQPDCAPAATSSNVDLIALGNTLSHSDPADFSDLIALARSDTNDGSRYDDPLTSTATPLVILDQEPHTDTAPLFTADTADPLVALHAEYRRALTHREHDYAHQLKTVEGMQTVVPAPEDPFLDIPGRYAQGSLLNDLLGDQQNIDTILDELDAFRADQLFINDERHEILLLLASEQKSNPYYSRTALLMRQEHHLVSMDSYLSMPTTTTDTLPEN